MDTTTHSSSIKGLADYIKPDFSQIKARWFELLNKYINPLTQKFDEKFLVSTNCLYCDSSDAYREFTLNNFRHLTCRKCQSVYVSPRLKDECLEELYSDEYYSCMYANSMIPVFEKRKSTIGKRKFEQTIFHLNEKNKKLNVLDIGAGIGEVIDCFKDAGHSCEATEMNKAAVSFLKSKGIKVFEGTLDTYNNQPGHFDVVMAWGVVEHVTDPIGFLKKACSLLKEDGIFVSEVPNGQSLLVDYCRDSSADPQRILMGEQHILLYSPEAYEELHNSCGFEKLHIQTNGLDVETIMKLNNSNLSPEVVVTLQKQIDSYLKGDLIRGFWRKKK